MNRRAILFVDHAPALGGAEQSLLLLLQHLDRDRWQPHLACAGGPLATEAQALGVDVHEIDLPRLRRSARFPLDWLGAAGGLARLARRTDAAALHSNTVRAALFTALAARLARRPFVWHMRDFWLSEARPSRTWLDRTGKRILCGASAAVIANSYAVARELPCPGRTTVIHNGIEVELFDAGADRQAARALLGLPADAPVVGMVGRLRPWKGQATFLRMAAAVRLARPDAWFLLVGGDPFGVEDSYAGDVRQLATQLGLADRAVFTGHVTDTRPALAAMDVFVHPGEPEPFGLVNLEAMAMARPVVAFAHGSLPEIVVANETGLLVPPGDEASLSQAILDLLADPAHTALMGRAGRLRLETHFTIQRTVAGIESVYDQLLGDE